MREIGKMIAEVLKSKGNEDVIKEVRNKVKELTSAFPLYEEYIREMERVRGLLDGGVKIRHY